METEVIDELIVGRVEPHIYAFTTNTVPNYLKVGDTYRPVAVRLAEWSLYFPGLKKEYEETARVSGDEFFRDYSVHDFLENTRHRARLTQGDIEPGIYFSREFFREATSGDVEEAIADIRRDHEAQGQRYQFYKAATSLPVKGKFPSAGMWTPRPNQQATIDRFVEAVGKGRRNLLMYAVMRFGKSFTSMCCAKTMNGGAGANLVVVVSAKADVKDEWRRTVESAENFRNDYEFFTSADLRLNPKVVSEHLHAKGKKAVVFLTLQDLQSSTVKSKHADLLKETVDLLIVDETHYGARAGEYGEILRKTKDMPTRFDREGETSKEETDKAVKAFRAKVTLHLSGTPYRILMGSEFAPEDIIAFYSFTDIAKDQRKWDEENRRKPEDEQEEDWDNPYYGFPQMIRFAFTPNESTHKRLAALRKNGATYAFSALFETESIAKDEDGGYRRFKYEQDVLTLFKVIDGSQRDEKMLAFLDYPKIKEGKMCRHIVCVLPYCASCDALAALLEANKDQFKNLGEYKILNVSGHDMPKEYGDVEAVRRAIGEAEKEDRKTLTLTVNRMLTGSTVPEWDTMLYFKDTSSAQEYDQAIFRLQNQYVQKMVSHDAAGTEKVIKFNKKPQTLLVDFDPDRLFRMQESKAKFYNVNEDKGGNARLAERIREEISFSPVVVLNAEGKLHRVEATDVMEAVSRYSRSLGVSDEARSIGVDLAALDRSKALLDAILRENPIDDKNGFDVKAHEGEGQDLITEEEKEKIRKLLKKDKKSDKKEPLTKEEEAARRKIERQLRAYYSRLLFFAFLTKDNVQSVEDIMRVMKTGENARIARNVGIEKTIVEAIYKYFDKFVLSDLDYKIGNLNKLSADEAVEPLERATTALRKFDRLGPSEIMTPEKTADEMVALLPEEELRKIAANGEKILDIAGKAGEFAIALYKRYHEIDPKIDVSDMILTIPTSGHAYEFTRRVYEALGLDVANIAARFTSYDLLKVKDKSGEIDYARIRRLLTQRKDFSEITMKDKISKKDKVPVTIAAVVGNPPYQVMNEKKSQGFASAIYPCFMDVAFDLEPKRVSMITPSRWLLKTGQGVNEEWSDRLIHSNHFMSVHDFHDAKDCFPGVEIKGGVSYFMYSGEYKGKCEFVNHVNGKSQKVCDYLDTFDCGVVVRDEIARSVLAKITKIEGDYYKENSFADLVGPTHLFDKGGQLGSSWSGFKETKDAFHAIKYYLNKRVIPCGFAWIKETDIPKGKEAIPLHKVYISEAYGAGEGFPHQILGVPFYGEPNSVCSQTYLCIGYDPKIKKLTQSECENIISYIMTKFFRYLVLIKKNTQHAFSAVYQFVPMQDFTAKSDIDWSQSVAEIDRRLYAKYKLTDAEIAFIESKIKPME